MSALPPKAGMCGAARDVRFGPEAYIGGLRKLDCLDIGFSAKSQRSRERYVVTARCDVVVMYGKSHVVDATFLDSFVVVVRKAEWPSDNDTPLAVFPAGDGIIIGCRSTRLLQRYTDGGDQ